MLKNRPHDGDEAKRLDAAWFAEIPKRRHRLCPIHPSEYGVFGSDTHIMVRRISPKWRLREPLPLLGVPLQSMEQLESDEHVATMLELVLREMLAAKKSGKTTEIGQILHRAVEKARARIATRH